MARNGPSSHPTHTTSRLLPTARLNPVAFAPFGEVIQNPATHGDEPRLESVKANQGSATKWLDVTKIHDFYDLSESGKGARVVMNMFVCQPRELEQVHDGGDLKMVFPVRILERHPFTAQTFIPLGFSAADRIVRYLVIVAPTLSSSTNDHDSTTRCNSSKKSTDTQLKGPGLPDLNNIKAFIAHGDQAVTYGPGTWHAPMVALGEKAIDFVVVQYSNGVAGEDCQEFEFEVTEHGESLVVDVGEILGVKPKL